MDLLTTHPARISSEYADERIREKIERFDHPKQKAGLRDLAADLKTMRLPPAAQLHWMTAITTLGLEASQSLPGRLARAQRPSPKR